MGHDELISAGTAAAYVVGGFVTDMVIDTEASLLFMLAMILLGVGTFLFHFGDWKKWKQDIDHAGMNAVYAVLAVHAVTGDLFFLVWALAGAIAVEYVMDHPNRVMMGIFVYIALAGGWQVRPYLALLGFVLMGIGFMFWNIKNQDVLGPFVVASDLAHGVWHVATALGTCLMFGAAA